MGLRGQRLPTRHGGVQALLLLGGKGVERGAKEVHHRNEAPIKIRLSKEPGDLQPRVVEVGLHIVAPGWHVRGRRISECFQGTVWDGGDEVFNTVTHHGRQGVIRQHTLGNVRQTVHNGVLGKGARLSAS
jgi:hypothetical protein